MGTGEFLPKVEKIRVVEFMSKIESMFTFAPASAIQACSTVTLLSEVSARKLAFCASSVHS